MKRSFFTLLPVLAAVCALVFALALGASAETVSGTCGKAGDGSGVTWTLDLDTGAMTISGTGAMDSYEPTDAPAPWKDYRSQIRTVTVEPGVTTVGSWAFWFCRNLTSATIADTVEEIEVQAFSSCRSLSSVTLPSGLTRIDKSVFAFCRNLRQVSIPSGVAVIDNHAFHGCPLTSVSLPDGLLEIGSFAFAETALTEVDVPASVRSIDMMAFNSNVWANDSEEIDSGYAYTNATYNTDETLLKITINNPQCALLFHGTDAMGGGQTDTYDESFKPYNLGFPGATVVCGYTGSTAETYANTYGYTFVPLDGEQEDPTLVYDQVGFSVAGAIRAQFAVYGWNHTSPAYDSYYIIVRHTLADGTTEVSDQIPLEANEYGGYTFYVGYYDVHAKYMADDLDVTVYGVKDGVTYHGPVSTTSIRAIAADMLTGGGSAAQKTVYANMLAYGAQAQLKFNYNVDDLANALTGEALTAYNTYVTNGAPDYATLDETVSTPANMGEEKVTFFTTGLSVEERVYLQFGLYFGNYDVSDFTIELKIGDATETVTTDKLLAIPGYPGYYALVIDTLDAVEGQTPVSVTVCEGDTPVSRTYTNTIENLASTKQGDDKLLADRLVNFYRAIDALLNP